MAPADLQSAQNSSSLLEYAKFLREEERNHREYLEKLYTTTTVVLGVLVTIGIGLINFFQVKTKEEVQKTVNAVFNETVGEEVRIKTERFRKDLFEIDEGQKLLKSEFQAVRMALQGNLTKYEHEYLKRLADPKPFRSEVGDGEYHEKEDMHHFNHEVYPRLKRLDDLGFVRPTEKDGKRRLMRIVEDHEEDQKKPDQDRPLFKLREYAEITDDGQKYLMLAGQKYLR
jgi:hypothetical protein